MSFLLCPAALSNFDGPKPRNLKLAERRVGKSLTLPILSVVLGLLLMLMGFVKLTPKLSTELYTELSRQFVVYAKSPSIFSLLGFNLDASQYRQCVGWCELVGGFMLFSSRGAVQIFTNVLMIVINLNTIGAHFSATEKFEPALDVAPMAVITLMLMCRLVVKFQVHLRVQNEFQRINSLEEEYLKKNKIKKPHQKAKQI